MAGKAWSFWLSTQSHCPKLITSSALGQKQTRAARKAMSAKCHERTMAGLTQSLRRRGFGPIAVSLRPWRNARKALANNWGDELPRKPITGIICCAVAISGHVAAQPRSVTNSRRLTTTPEARVRASQATKSSPPKGVIDVRFRPEADICGLIQ